MKKTNFMQEAVDKVLANTILLGGIAYNATAPTPGKNGIYEFISAGSCSWITGGAVTVAIGDRVIVVYSGNSYTYTYQANQNTNTDMYNVTVRVPLSAGSYYTLSTAITAIPTSVKKKGLLIEFEIASTIWNRYIYVGTDLTGWSTISNWILMPAMSGATFKGIATPTTVPGTPDGNVFYIAINPGIYSNFNGISITLPCIFSNKTGNWIKTDLPLALSDWTKKGNLLMPEYSANQSVGNWQISNNSTLSFNNNDKCIDVLTSGSAYSGMKTIETYPALSKMIICFEIKGNSGDNSNIGVSFMDVGSEVIKIPITSEWKKLYLMVERTNPVSTANAIGIINYNASIANFSIRNIYFSLYPNYEYFSMKNIIDIDAKFGQSDIYTYEQPNILGYINALGNYISGDYGGHYCTDYIPVVAGDKIYIASGTTCGSSAILCAYYNTSKTFISSINNGYEIPNNGFVRFTSNNATSVSFALIQNFSTLIDYLKNNISINQNSINGILDIIKKGSILSNDYSCNQSVGNWTSRNGSILTYDNTNKCVVVSGDGTQNYCGLNMPETNETPNIPRIAILQVKGNSGDYSNIGLSYATYPLPTTNKLAITSEWKTFVIELPIDGTNKNMTLLSYNSAAFNISVKNLFYADFPNYEYFALLQFKSLYSLKSTVELIQSNSIINQTNGSIEKRIIDNNLSDFGLPSWVGKSELRTTDLTPSINTQGQSYLFDNLGTLELRLVKDATTIVGCALSTKKQNAVIPKTFSMCHFGDSITYGVGASPNYVSRLKTLLETDGHTISTQTNLGISGSTAESNYNTYKNTTPLHHDIATLMIGINDQDRWLSQKNTTWQTTGLKPEDFRTWYRTNLRLLLDTIRTYSTPTKIFLIVPYKSVCEIRSGNPYPSITAYYSQPLQNIVVQEVLSIVSDYNDINICRADYYVPNSYDYIPDGLHANNNGAQLLAKGLRDEITFRV